MTGGTDTPAAGASPEQQAEILRKATADADTAEIAARKAKREEDEASTPAAVARRATTAEKDAAAARREQVAALIPDLSKVSRGELELAKGGEPTAGTAVGGAALEDAAQKIKQAVVDELGADGWSVLVTNDAELAVSDAAYTDAVSGVNRLTKLAIDTLAATAGALRTERSLVAAAAVIGAVAQAVPQYAEAALDEAISAPLPKPSVVTPDEGWVVTQLTLRGTITGALGQPFLLPDPRAAADRLIAIVGLGLPGRLGSGELTVAVRELCWAVGRLGRSHLATVLIGSGVGNLSEGDAVEAWANGIAQALGGQDPGAPRLSRVTIVERDGKRLAKIDDALQATVTRMGRNQELELVYKAASRKTREGWSVEEEQPPDQTSREQGPAPASGPVPTRMTISREPRGYRFGAITKDASIPERDVPLDGALVNQANDELAGEADDYVRRERGRFLGKLLMPRDLHDQLGGSGPVVMILDSTTARIHWELVTRARAEPAAPGARRAGDLKDYLGVGLGITRQLRTTFAPPPEPPPPPERVLRVLVVADPAEDAHLPGAEEEGSEVADLFERVNAPNHPVSVEVVRLFGPRQASRTEVLRRLLMERFHILHFAGHCFYDAEEPSASGWVFSDGGTLSANEMRRIDRVPEFVFSNACESGITPDRSGERSAELAPSFAESFFARGVGNFVCTAWPVDDAAARTFATDLYSALLGLDDSPPLPMYRAMQRAREAISTWPAARAPGGLTSTTATRSIGS